MRKSVIGVSFIFLLVFGAGLVMSQASAEYADQIHDAFLCLDAAIDAKPSLSLEEAVFTSLSGSTDSKIDQTFREQKSTSEECWPRSGCRVQETAQVAFAMNERGDDVSLILDWLESKSGAIQGLTWFLQISIDGNQPAECAIEYGTSESVITIDDALQLSGNAGSCLTRANSQYWLEVSDGCLDESFEVSCNASFKTNLLYQDSSGGTVFVSSTTHSASQGAWTTETINAQCFREGGTCDYEASLWATSVLSIRDRDTSQYGPYLRALATENSRFFPSTFLLFALGETSMSDDLYQSILNKKKTGGIWDIIGSPHSDFYNSALAILSLGSGSGGGNSPHVQSGLRDLFDEQDSSGCFNNNHLSDSAFLLYSGGWSRSADGSCTPLGQRTSAASPTCCSGVELPDSNIVGEGCSEGGFYGFCSNCGDGILQPWEDACNCPADAEGEIAADSCFNGFWYAGNPVEAINTSAEAGYCHLADSGNWENGCCVNGFECAGEGNESICEPAPGSVTTQSYSNECAGGYWYTEEGERVDTHDEAGYCQLEVDNEDWPDGCCRRGYACSADGNESICERVDDGSGGGSSQTDCELAGLYCVADGFTCVCGGSDECTGNGGVVDRSLRCSNQIEACCTVDVQEKSCFDQGGVVCAFDEECTGSVLSASDGACCTDTCVPITEGGGSTGETSECSIDADCFGDEECDNGRCVATPEENSSDGGLIWWIIFFVLLIGLVILAIVYRDRLRVWWFKMRGRAKSSKVKPGPPGTPSPVARRAPPRFGPPGRRPPVMRRSVQIPSRKRPPVRARAGSAKDAAKEKEMEETLKKLREMSK